MNFPHFFTKNYGVKFGHHLSGAELTQEADDIPLAMAAPQPGKSSMGMVAFVVALVLAAAGVGFWAMFLRGNNGQPVGGAPAGAPGARGRGATSMHAVRSFEV